MADNYVLNTKLSSKEIDSVKGFLILCIIFGHNIYLSTALPEMRTVLYNFHVIGFLIFSFIFPPKKFSKTFILDRAVRYLVPFLFFYLLTSILYFFMYVGPDDRSTWFLKALIAPFIATVGFLGDTCGFELYWFLPALFTLVLFRAIFTSCNKIQKIFFIIAILFTHLTIGELSTTAKMHIPMGLAIVCFSFFVCLVFQFSWGKLIARKFFPHIAIIGFLSMIILTLLIFHQNSSINIGGLNLYSYKNLYLLIFHDVYCILVVILISVLSPFLSKIPMISTIGKYSLLIYLTHQIIFHSYDKIIKIAIPKLLEDAPGLNILLSLAVTISIALVVSIIITKITITKKLIIPKTYEDWLLTKK